MTTKDNQSIVCGITKGGVLFSSQKSEAPPDYGGQARPPVAPSRHFTIITRASRSEHRLVGQWGSGWQPSAQSGHRQSVSH